MFIYNPRLPCGKTWVMAKAMTKTLNFVVKHVVNRI